MEANILCSPTKPPVSSENSGSLTLGQSVSRENSPDSRNAVNGENK